MTNSVYFETIPGDESSVGDSIYAMIKNDDLKRYEMSKSNFLLFGRSADNLTELVTETNLDTPISSSEGLVDFALTAGTIQNYTVGSYTLDDFDSIGNVYYDERSATVPDIMCFDGPSIATETENVFVNTLQQNLISSVDRIIDGYAQYMTETYQEGLDAKSTDMTLAFGYSCIQKNGFIFHLKRLSEFNDIKRLGGAQYPNGYRFYRIAMPIGWNTDVVTGGTRSIIGYEYKQLGSYQRENVFGDLPGAGVGGSNSPYGRAVDQYDRMRYFLMSHLGGHWAVGNSCVTQRPS